MTPYYEKGGITIYHGDARGVGMSAVSPGWGNGRPAGGRYWTKARVVAALRKYAADNRGALPVDDHEWSNLKKGRLDLPTAGRILELWHSMARAWLVVGIDKDRVPRLNTRWTNAEITFLLDHAGTLTLDEIASRLNRSYAAVRTKLGAKGYGLKARENAGFLTAAACAKEYSCSVNRIYAMLTDGTLKGTYFEKGHRWHIDPSDAEKVRALLVAPKKTHTTVEVDLGDYRQRYGIRRLSIHKLAVSA